jgi:hypothetical protein
LLLLSISYFYLGGNNLVTSVASLPEAVIPVAFGAGILGTSMAVGGSLSVFVGTGIGVARAVDGIFN